MFSKLKVYFIAITLNIYVCLINENNEVLFHTVGRLSTFIYDFFLYDLFQSTSTIEMSV